MAYFRKKHQPVCLFDGDAVYFDIATATATATEM
jgi:ectoine hydroxylase-related dioxygenase (phytanoyl-CoA dioxygenase family)